MTSQVFTWVPRNAKLQADVPVDHFAAGVAAAEGWQQVVEWRFRADPGDAWGPATIDAKTPPECSSTFNQPGAGWIQLTSYSLQNGKRSRATLVREWEVDSAGDVVTPARYVDEDGNPYVDENADTYYDA